MSLAAKDIKKIAHLARFNIDEEQIPSYINNLSKTLELVEQINNADTNNISPMAHPLEDMQQRLREDIISEEVDRDLYLQLAPETEDGVYLVPKVIDSKS